MARAIWTGSLGFGLVNVPVGLYSATEDKTIHFNQFQSGTADRVRNRRVNERTGEEVPFSDVVKGFDLGGGEYVIVTPEELESVEPEKSSTIDVLDFVELGDIDPIFFQRTYYLAPQGEQAKRAYGLLLEIMRREGKVGIASFVMRNKEYLVAVRPADGVLALETMYFADEIRDPGEEIDSIPVETEFSKRELDTAKLLLESMTGKWDPKSYRDTYRERVEELIERKRKGEAVVVEPVREKPAGVVDLADALQRSVEAARDRYRREKADGGERSSQGNARDGAEAKRTTRRGGPKPSSRSEESVDDLSKKSKADLYEIAAGLEVAGRSRMSREDLERAIRSAGAPGRRRAS